MLVTGAAGQIAYSLLFPIAKGDVFGKDQVSVCHITVFPLFSPGFSPVGGLEGILHHDFVPSIKTLFPHKTFQKTIDKQ